MPSGGRRRASRMRSSCTPWWLCRPIRGRSAPMSCWAACGTPTWRRKRLRSGGTARRFQALGVL